MGIHILKGEKESCLYCSTSMWAFGPIFYNDEDPEAFLDWHKGADVRTLKDKDLERAVSDWRDREVCENCLEDITDDNPLSHDDPDALCQSCAESRADGIYSRMKEGE